MVFAHRPRSERIALALILSMLGLVALGLWVATWALSGTQAALYAAAPVGIAAIAAGLTAYLLKRALRQRAARRSVADLGSLRAGLQGAVEAGYGVLLERGFLAVKHEPGSEIPVLTLSQETTSYRAKRSKAGHGLTGFTVAVWKQLASGVDSAGCLPPVAHVVRRLNRQKPKLESLPSASWMVVSLILCQLAASTAGEPYESVLVFLFRTSMFTAGFCTLAWFATKGRVLRQQLAEEQRAWQALSPEDQLRDPARALALLGPVPLLRVAREVARTQSASSPGLAEAKLLSSYLTTGENTPDHSPTPTKWDPSEPSAAPLDSLQMKPVGRLALWAVLAVSTLVSFLVLPLPLGARILLAPLLSFFATILAFLGPVLWVERRGRRGMAERNFSRIELESLKAAKAYRWFSSSSFADRLGQLVVLYLFQGRLDCASRTLAVLERTFILPRPSWLTTGLGVARSLTPIFTGNASDLRETPILFCPAVRALVAARLGNFKSALRDAVVPRNPLAHPIHTFDLSRFVAAFSLDQTGASRLEVEQALAGLHHDLPFWVPLSKHWPELAAFVERYDLLAAYQPVDVAVLGAAGDEDAQSLLEEKLAECDFDASVSAAAEEERLKAATC